MVRLRLKKMGSKKRPFYRIVAMDQRTKRDGRAIDELGYYDVIKQPAEIKVNKEKALEWLKKGAQPTDTVKNILSKEGIMKEFHDYKYNTKK